MKKIILLFVIACSIASYAAPNGAFFHLKNGVEYTGSFISRTDSTITIFSDLRLSNMTISFSEIAYCRYNGQYFLNTEEGLTEVNKDQYIKGLGTTDSRYTYKIDQNVVAEQPRRADPNYVIGSSLKATGTVAMSVGVPSLFVGSILMGVGLADHSGASVPELERYGRMTSAGYVLVSVGGALTIVGIPLHVYGNKIIKLDVTTTGTGVGARLEF